MKIEIIVFKPSGKYYTSKVIENEKDVFLFEDDFRHFVANNLPALISDGYVVVLDCIGAEDGQSFHIVHYAFNEIIKYRTII